MFDEFKNIDFSRTFIDVSEVELEVDLSELESDIMDILVSCDASIAFCEEEHAEVGLSFDCWDSTVDPASVDAYTVAELTLARFESGREIEGEDLSFELTYPRKITYEELLHAYKVLLGSIYEVIADDESLP